MTQAGIQHQVRGGGDDAVVDSEPVVRLRAQRFHAVTEDRCVELMTGADASMSGGWVVTANLDHLRRMVRHRCYGELCSAATLVVADGMPLVWAARIQGTPLPERVAGSNLIWSLSAAAASRGKSVFLLGGAPGTARAAANVLTERYPALRVAGTHCPPVGFEHDSQQMAELTEALRQAEPDTVYVALGSPKQERLIAQLRQVLPGAWWMGVGISFSFLCGDVKRAPRWMQRLGLEWVHRLAQEPRRLARRYLVDDLPFAMRLLGGAAVRRLRRTPEPSAETTKTTSPARE